MISQKYRFHGHSSIKYLFSNGKINRGKYISIKYIHNSRRKYSRVAIIVSKKVFKHAVDRNRVRRRLYEIMRQRIDNFAEPIDMAVIVYRADVLTMSYQKLVSEVDKCLNQGL